MKLANPRTIQQDLSEQRRVDIDNGIQLARRVDTLRATLSDLEQKHDLFIRGTTSALREKTESLHQAIFLQEQEIESLQKKREELLKPVTIKWDEIHSKEQQLEETKNVLDRRQNSLNELEEDIKKRIKLLSDDETRMEVLKKQISIQVEKVSNTSLQAQNMLLEARKEEERITLQLNQKQEDLDKLQLSASLREKNILSREKELEKQEQHIINEKIRLADQRATLERAMKRINK